MPTMVNDVPALTTAPVPASGHEYPVGLSPHLLAHAIDLFLVRESGGMHETGGCNIDLWMRTYFAGSREFLLLTQNCLFQMASH